MLQPSLLFSIFSRGGGGGGGLNREGGLLPGKGVLGSIFAGYVPLASQSPFPILVYSVANYRPHLSHFCGNENFGIPT